MFRDVFTCFVCKSPEATLHSRRPLMCLKRPAPNGTDNIRTALLSACRTKGLMSPSHRNERHYVMQVKPPIACSRTGCIPFRLRTGQRYALLSSAAAVN